MDIGILTLPLHANYGGILQAYALKSVLQACGHQVVFIDHQSMPNRLPLLFRYPIYLKRFLLKYLLGRDIKVRREEYYRKLYRNMLAGTAPFIHRYIQTACVRSASGNFPRFHAVVVGSDQVWRETYANFIGKFFLDFLECDASVRKIVYAASFGTDVWELTPAQTAVCARLVRQFSRVSVREDSGVELCRKYLGIEAEQVLDPTLLLGTECYVSLVHEAQVPKSAGNLFSYMLDDSAEKRQYVCQLAQRTGLTAFSLLPTEEQLMRGAAYPGVEVWLRAFMDAELVVTDSYHGCVFSILFNKPFIAVGNVERGQARFDSLFRMFCLHHRLVDVSDLSYEPLSRSVDWDEVNGRLHEYRQKSRAFLHSALGSGE